MGNHDREFEVRALEAELGLTISEWLTKHGGDLTRAEYAQIVHRVCHRVIDKALYRIIESERNEVDDG